MGEWQPGKARFEKAIDAHPRLIRAHDDILDPRRGPLSGRRKLIPFLAPFLALRVRHVHFLTQLQVVVKSDGDAPCAVRR
jgi:hypothetical protein